MVEIMVKDAPLTILKIARMSVRGTIPISKVIAAPMVVGIVSLMPKGLHNINIIVSEKIIIISKTSELPIYFCRLASREKGCVRYFCINESLLCFLFDFKRRLEKKVIK
jgi:hypothetical protein